jgi:hypothetical protein
MLFSRLRFLETPFFGVSQKQEREKAGKKPFFAVPDAGFEVGEGVHLEGGLAEVLLGTERWHAGG